MKAACWLSQRSSGREKKQQLVGVRPSLCAARGMHWRRVALIEFQSQQRCQRSCSVRNPTRMQQFLGEGSAEGEEGGDRRGASICGLCERVRGFFARRRVHGIACHCFAPELMFFTAPSARVINQGSEPRVSRLIRLSEQINCARVAACDRKVPLIVEEGTRAGT